MSVQILDIVLYSHDGEKRAKHHCGRTIISGLTLYLGTGFILCT